MTAENRSGYSIDEILKIMELIPQQKVNPLTAGILQGGSVLGDILSQVFGKKSPEEELTEWRLGERKKLMPKLASLPEGYHEGDVLGRLSLSRKALQPTMDKIGFNFGGSSGMGSGETKRMIMEKIGEILAGREFDIRNRFDELGEQRRRFKYGTMAGIV